MNSFLRFGMLIIVIGLAGFLAVVVRSNPVVFQRQLSLTPSGYDALHLFLGPQELRLDFDAQQTWTIDIYVFNSTGFSNFLSKRPYQPLFSGINITHGPFLAKMAGRDSIDLVILNTSLAPISLNLTLTVYGFESDLLWASSLLLISGASLSVVGYQLLRSSEKSVRHA